ncbi:MAG: DNRLRE domain-containing protein, partial [Anaerolineae bacterium]|nr:DNRLRE domain-containing protein [Anaerolineae bacterium]
YLEPDGKIVRSLVRFDLSSIPTGATINQATLRLYLVSSWDYPNRTRTITTYRIGSSWSESGVTWNNQPSHAEAFGSAGVTHGAWGWYAFDVTNLVRGWVNGTWPNYGIMLRGPEWSGTDSSWKSFATRESTYDPQLVITYIGTASASLVMPDKGESQAPTTLITLGVGTDLPRACTRQPVPATRCLNSLMEQ